jgi:hypothetical protein
MQAMYPVLKTPHMENTTLIMWVLKSLLLYTYEYILLSTKYVYTKSTTVYVPSSELGLSQPLSRQQVCPSPQNRGGTLAGGLGVGGVPIPTTGEKA